MMNPREVARDYNLTARGTVSSPGKFEGEMWYAVAIWDLVLNGGADLETGEDPIVAWFRVDAAFVEGFEIHATDREAFASTYAPGSYLGIWEDSQGFVRLTSSADEPTDETDDAGEV